MANHKQNKRKKETESISSVDKEQKKKRRKMRINNLTNPVAIKIFVNGVKADKPNICDLFENP